MRTVFALLLVLLTSGVAGATSHETAAVRHTPAICKSKSSIPFYHDTKALLSSAGLVNSSEHASEGGGLYLLFPHFSDRCLFLCSSSLIALANPYFALLFKYAILYPFHSFW